MIDLTSALYLGFTHPAAQLHGWGALTTGAPAALRPTPGSHAAGVALAALTGRETAMVAPSTLHIACDLFAVLGRGASVVLIDAGAYPVMRWGARAAGLDQHVFGHHDEAALRHALAGVDPRIRPIVVCDGVCTRCGQVAPLTAYAAIAAQHGGWLVVDDTQALGVLGAPAPGSGPYGAGGGGAAATTTGGHVVVVASAAKALGVPVGLLAATATVIERYAARSPVRVHTSQVSAADLSALTHALELHTRLGTARRTGLARRVRAFRAGLRGSGLLRTDGLLPVQQLTPPRGVPTAALWDRLMAAGVRTIGLADGHLACAITATHPLGDIVRAAAVIARQVTALRRSRPRDVRARATRSAPCGR